MHFSIRRAIAALTPGEDAQRHYDLAAQRLQQALLTVAVPTIPGLQIGVRAEPARLVGGDYVDLLATPEGHLIFGLGDASGKSLAAALNAMMVRYLVRGLVAALGPRELAKIVEHANTVISDDVTEGSFVTFLIGVLDPGSGLLRIVNAGHEPPLILRERDACVTSISRHGLVLGIDRSSTFQEDSVILERGDLVAVYTDGLTEATNERGELYTMECLADAFIERRSLAPQEIADSLFDTVKRYSVGGLRDDATILVLRLV